MQEWLLLIIPDDKQRSNTCSTCRTFHVGPLPFYQVLFVICLSRATAHKGHIFRFFLLYLQVWPCLLYYIFNWSPWIHFFEIMTGNKTIKKYIRLKVRLSSTFCNLNETKLMFLVRPYLNNFYFNCRHDIAEILLKVALNTRNQSINLFQLFKWYWNCVCLL
jgi:hypothetical protein